MTILELTFATNQLTTTFFNHKLEPLHQKTFPFEALTIEETVPELCQLILAEAPPILGGGLWLISQRISFRQRKRWRWFRKR